MGSAGDNDDYYDNEARYAVMSLIDADLLLSDCSFTDGNTLPSLAAAPDVEANFDFAPHGGPPFFIYTDLHFDAQQLDLEQMGPDEPSYLVKPLQQAPQTLPRAKMAPFAGIRQVQPDSICFQLASLHRAT